MNIINVTVRGKMARAEERARVVCGNSDYAVKFDFDDEWSAESVKTARFTTDNGTYTDVQFEGDTCTVPILANTRTLQVGVYAGNLRTTTAALIHALPCVTDPDGTPADPAPDVYNQLMDRLNDLETIDPAEIDKAVKDYLTEHPIEETDPTVPAWAKQPQKPTYTAAEIGAATEADVTAAVNGAWTQAVAKLGPMFDSKQDKLNITNATAGQIPQITAVDASGVPTAWGAVDLPSGGGGGSEAWELIASQTVAEDVLCVDISVPSFAKLMALVSLVNTSASTGNRSLQLVLNGNNTQKAVTSDGAIIRTSGTSSVRYNLMKIDGRIIWSTASANNGDGVVDKISENMMCFNSGACNASDTISNIRISNNNLAANYYIGAGTRIKVYVVRGE